MVKQLKNYKCVLIIMGEVVNKILPSISQQKIAINSPCMSLTKVYFHSYGG